MLPSLALLGYARSGKDSIAEHLVEYYGYERVAFADPLKAMALKINPYIVDENSGERWLLSALVAAYGWEIAKDRYPEVRVFLQNLGNTLRDEVDPNIWLNKGLRRIEECYQLGAPVVVTDVRYGNEVNALKSQSFRTVRVMRPGTGPANGHKSESETAGWWTDDVIVNDGTLPDLHDKIERLIAR